MQASGLALPAASVADLAALAGLGEPEAEADAGPTMMSREARALIAAGDGQAGLLAWKVRRITPLHHIVAYRLRRQSLLCTGSHHTRLCPTVSLCRLVCDGSSAHHKNQPSARHDNAANGFDPGLTARTEIPVRKGLLSGPAK